MTPQEIHERRLALGWTQEELASRVGVTRVAVTHWESGSREPSGSAQMLLRLVLGDTSPNPPKKSRRAG